jgi:hypothetical protein
VQTLLYPTELLTPHRLGQFVAVSNNDEAASEPLLFTPADANG